jgi:hypothetical protein
MIIVKMVVTMGLVIMSHALLAITSTVKAMNVCCYMVCLVLQF